MQGRVNDDAVEEEKLEFPDIGEITGLDSKTGVYAATIMGKICRNCFLAVPPGKRMLIAERVQACHICPLDSLFCSWCVCSWRCIVVSTYNASSEDINNLPVGAPLSVRE